MNFNSDIDEFKDANKPSTSAITAEKSVKQENIEPLKEDDEPKIEFKCEICAFSERCHYKGKRPPFANKIELIEESYVMKDPFSPPPGAHSTKSNSEYFIVIGAHCMDCDRMVCKSSECSIFYTKTFCLSCAKNHIRSFPVEVQSKIKKQLAATGMI